MKMILRMDRAKSKGEYAGCFLFCDIHTMDEAGFSPIFM